VSDCAYIYNLPKQNKIKQPVLFYRCMMSLADLLLKSKSLHQKNIQNDLAFNSHLKNLKSIDEIKEELFPDMALVQAVPDMALVQAVPDMALVQAVPDMALVQAVPDMALVQAVPGQFNLYSNLIKAAAGLQGDSPMLMPELTKLILKLSPEEQQILFDKITAASLALAIGDSDILLQPDTIDFLKSISSLNFNVSTKVTKVFSIADRLQVLSFKSPPILSKSAELAQVMYDHSNLDGGHVNLQDTSTFRRNAIIGASVGLGLICMAKYGSPAAVITISNALVTTLSDSGGNSADTSFILTNFF
jgi:hypothetical protein